MFPELGGEPVGKLTLAVVLPRSVCHRSPVTKTEGKSMASPIALATSWAFVGPIAASAMTLPAAMAFKVFLFFI